jgi:hypothetical protein
MNRTSSAPQGMLYLGDSFVHVENAIIDDVVADTDRTGYVLISFEVSDENNMTYEQEVRLNVWEDTMLIDENGINLSLDDLEEGMRIDADFSSAMTRSIPPQSAAYRIVVLEEDDMVEITVDRVVGVDVNNGFLQTGNPHDMNDQMIFTISDETVILDQDNNSTTLEKIQPGQLVYVEHAIFQTLSIPPQSPAYRVQIL